MMRSGARLAVLLAVAAMLAAASDVRLGPDGWFRTADGALFVPLGGFHGNELPLSMIGLSDEEERRVEPYLFSAQKTAGRGHVDLWDASDETMRGWFRQLAERGVTAVRLFPRARVGGDTLDLCGKLNPELRHVLSRAFAAARPYGIRFLLQILPEPSISGYWNPSLVKRYALPRYSKAELEQLTPAQRRFLIEGKRVEYTRWFTDPDVLACQKLYLESALAWVAAEPQVFALEVYNEQGWSRPPPARAAEFPADWEGAEIAWTAEIVRFIHQRLPGIPVTISHPGYGLAGYDPVWWSVATGVDFYSTHFYAGMCGENRDADFAAVTAAATAVIRARVPTFPGEWGVLGDEAPEAIRRRAHRDALWLSLLAGAPGFMQWTYEYLEEYRWPARVIGALPHGFSPDPPPVSEDISVPWRAFQEAPAAMRPPSYRLNGERAADRNLRRLLRDYRRGLDRGTPLGFTFGGVAKTAEGDVPIRARGGYQVAWMGDRARRVWVAYLRSRKVGAFGTQFLGVPVPRRLDLDFDLPPGEYHVALIDLERDRLERYRLGNNAGLNVSSRTDSDYVLIVSADPIAL